MTRRNLCPNPAAKNNTTGWGGNANPARVTGLTGFPSTTGMKAANSGFTQSPTGACAPGDQLVVSFYQQSPGILGTKTVYAAFTRTAGGDDFSQTFTTSLDGTVKRATATVTAPANATGVYLIFDGIAADVVMTDVMYEPGTVDGGYADGDTSGWAWDGTNGNSTSSETGLTSVTGTLSAPWAIRGTISQSLSTPWTLRASVSRPLDVPWAQRAVVAQSLATPWAIRGVASVTLTVPWVLRGQISALLGVPWTVRRRVTSTLQTLWVVEGENHARAASIRANLTDYVTAYLDM